MPKPLVEFWSTKLNGNRARDDRAFAKLKQAGWDVLVLRECELANLNCGRKNVVIPRPTKSEK